MNLTGEYTIGGGADNKGILGALDDQRSGVQFCDVTLFVEDDKFPAHRCVLAAASPYFNSMFEEFHFKESRKAEVELKSVSKKAIQVILDMIYSGTLKLKVENMHEVLSAGDIFLMNEVKFSCAEFMLMVLNSEIAPNEALKIRRSAALYSLTDLEHEADRVITLSFAQVAQSAAFCDLDYQELLSFLQSDYIQESNEYVFWEAAIVWIRHDEENRVHLLDNLMECVRFPLINPEVLLNAVSKDSLMAKSSRCKELIEEAMKYQLLPHLQSSMQSARTKPRCTIRNTVIYCLSGSSFKCYIPAYNRWYSLKAPPGKSDKSPLAKSVPDENSHSHQCYLVTVGGLVYACTQATRLEEVGNYQVVRMQQYSLTTNSWKECALPTKVSVPTFLIECNNELFACSRNAVERFIADKNVWEVVSISRLSPCQFAVSDDNKILLFTLEEGICQEMCMDRPNMVTTRQVMTPNRFISEVISATKLASHDVFLSLRTLSGISRKIFNVKSNLWRDAGIFYGSSSIQPRPGQHFPHWMNPSEPWITLCDRNSNELYITATRSAMCDIPSPKADRARGQVAPAEPLRDGVLPFFKLDIVRRTWTRLAALPEYMDQPSLSMCISDGQSSMGSAIVMKWCN